MFKTILARLKSIKQTRCQRNSDRPCEITSSIIISELLLTDLPTIEAWQGDGRRWELGPSQQRGNLYLYDPINWKVKVTEQTENHVIFMRALDDETPESRIRYLKWREECCTGMELDAEAREFVTGPFSGCSFYMFTNPDSRRPVILHSNAKRSRNTSITQEEYALNYLFFFHPNAMQYNKDGSPNIDATFPIKILYRSDLKRKGGWIIGTVSDNDPSVWQLCYVITEHLEQGQSYCVGLGSFTIAV